MFVVWGVIIPASIFAARYGKTYFHNLWFPIHRALSIIGLLIIVIAIVIIFIATPIRAIFHSILGLIVVILTAVLQIPLGIYIDKVFDPSRGKIPNHDIAHWWIGRILFLAACVAIPTGIWEYSDSGAIGVKVSYFIWQFAVIPTVFGVFEWQMRKKKQSEV